MPMLDIFTSVPTADPVVPHLGTYVFLTLDPEASVEALHDPVATEQARELPTKTYVGTVCDIIDLPIPDRRYHKCGIFLLSRGLPVAKPEQGLDEAMCVAIHPSAHPTGRVEIAAPKIPFPWDNLYHHAEGSIEVRLDQGGYDFSTCPSISLDDIIDALVALDDDHYRSVELRRNYEAAHPPPPLAVTTEPFSPPPTSDSDHASFSEVEEEPASPISPSPVTVNKDKLARAESQGTELDLPDVLLKIGRNLMGQDLEDSRDVLVPIARYSTNWTNPPTHELHDGELMAAEIKAIQRIVTMSIARRSQHRAENQVSLEMLQLERDLALGPPSDTNARPTPDPVNTASSSSRQTESVRGLERERKHSRDEAVGTSAQLNLRENKRLRLSNASPIHSPTEGTDE